MSSIYRQLFPLVIAAVLAAPGCSVFQGNLNPNNLNKVESNNSLSILYRTESDRLNLAAGSATIQQVSYQQNRTSLLPPVSTSTLKVVYPHPGGRPDHAQVFVAFSPNSGESATESTSFLTKLAGFGSSTSDQPIKPFEIWTLDVPKYQVDGIVAKLQKENFFRRSKVLSSNTYLGVKLDGKGFGKNYRNVDELDALIVRVRQQGWPLGPDGKPLRNHHPMPPRQGQGVYQARAETPWNGNGATGPNQRTLEYRPQPRPGSSDLQPGLEPSRDVQPRSDQPRYEQPPYDQTRNDRRSYDQPRYEHPQQGLPTNDQPRYDQARLDRPPFEQLPNNPPLYQQPRYDTRPAPGPPTDFRQPPAQTYMR